MSLRDRSLDKLSARFKPLAEELLKQIAAAGLKVMVIETLRSEEAHQEDVKAGKSWVKRSKHQDGDAIDIAMCKNNKPDWLDIPGYKACGQIGEKLGLVWGGRWKVRDWGHFEFK